MPLIAQLTTEVQSIDTRRALRRSLQLEVKATSHGASSALIRNLSERGLLIETAADLAIGETLHVDLPEAGAVEARIVWRDGSFFGCEFLAPVSKAAVSAALLLAPANRVQASPLPALPANSVFGEALDREVRDLDSHSPGKAILMGSLILALIMAVLFIFALLTFPFSV